MLRDKLLGVSVAIAHTKIPSCTFQKKKSPCTTQLSDCMSFCVPDLEVWEKRLADVLEPSDTSCNEIFDVCTKLHAWFVVVSPKATSFEPQYQLRIEKLWDDAMLALWHICPDDLAAHRSLVDCFYWASLFPDWDPDNPDCSAELDVNCGPVSAGLASIESSVPLPIATGRALSFEPVLNSVVDESTV